MRTCFSSGSISCGAPHQNSACWHQALGVFKTASTKWQAGGSEVRAEGSSQTQPVEDEPCSLHHSGWEHSVISSVIRNVPGTRWTLR